MKSAILLIFQLVLGVALFVVEPSPFGILQENPQSWLKWYQETAEALSIPFCLLLFSFSRKALFLVLRLAWGLWTSLISTALLWQASVHFPGITELGQIAIAFNAVFGFSLSLFAIIEISKKIPAEVPAPISMDEALPKTSEPEMDLVEGA